MKTTTISILRALCAALAATVASAFLCGAHASTQCGPSGVPGMERCVSGLSPMELMQMQQTQKASSWCWAASISMVLRRYGSGVSQEQVVRAQFADMANSGVSAEVMLRLLNRAWRDDAGRAFVSSAATLPKWRHHLGLMAPEVIDDLANGKPVLVGMQEHAMVLVQLVYDRPVGTSAALGGVQLLRAVVLDPASGSGVRSLRTAERVPEFLARVIVEAQETVTPPQGLVAATTHTML